MTVDHRAAAAAVAQLLHALGEDPTSARLSGTPARVADTLAEFVSGKNRDAAAVFDTAMQLEQVAAKDEIVALKGLQFTSLCEHHLLPFSGSIDIAYVPGSRVAGFGSFSRLVQTVALRLQMQERITSEIADGVMAGLDARGVLVFIEARHGCVSARGPRETQATAVTTVSRGVLDEPAQRLIALEQLRRSEP
ncbi:GTP cyclohydrolase I [Canibacter zhoujuaniae]|uniref:GTP cyclohydrolase I n=1 Tax=Canibacter zhoujuaniae TaxID=2708343 RepID=UPI00141E7139|nr:GTP cyclohydrolase I FolE [Canibacter zhoujuaniae]